MSGNQTEIEGFNYIITPYHQDYYLTCRDNKIDPRSRKTLWVNRAEQFFGRKIFEHDKIIWGHQWPCMKTEEIERIKIEIKIRKKA